jgi:hypothetical protein
MKEADLTEEKVAELKKKHGNDIRMVEAPNGDVIVVHKPSAFVWARWQKHISDDKKDREQSVRALVFGCLAAPEEATVAKLCDEYPVLPNAVTDVIAEMGGGVIDPKKL